MYGKEIKNIRLTHGLTQTQVEAATGIPQETLSWIENDKGIANIQQCVLLANLYEISLDELIGREIKNK
ncbi:MAG: helix-turn-helix transcriptional regulator [Clostridia bacterium]|nr:helix-turn-helix transcriptional regulator [Clostridia bacterium]